MDKEYVELQCLKVKSKLRVRIITRGYMSEANCQFPRDLRVEGHFYRVAQGNVRLVSTRGKYYYSISKSSVICLGQNRSKADVDRADANGEGNFVEVPASLTVFEDEGSDECCICLCEAKNIVFNCGHLYTCTKCSVMVSSCPICRQKIVVRINVTNGLVSK